MYARILLSLFMLLLLACTPEPETGPGDVRWDRETCTRCNMSIGDRNYAAQVRGGDAGAKKQLYKFDDIGCAIVWLQQQGWKDDSSTEIWVADFRNGQWLDARQASYVKDKLTPMNYGLGAQSESVQGALDFSQAITHILASENEKHQHGGRAH